MSSYVATISESIRPSLAARPRPRIGLYRHEEAGPWYSRTVKRHQTQRDSASRRSYCIEISDPDNPGLPPRPRSKAGWLVGGVIVFGEGLAFTCYRTWLASPPTGAKGNCQNLMVPSNPPVARDWPSGANARVRAPL